MKPSPLVRRAAPLAAALAMGALPACDADDGAPAPKPTEGPLYVVHSGVQSPSGERTNYFTLVGSLTDEATLDYAGSIEVPGRARLYAEPGVGYFGIGDGEDVSITRYDLGADGAITPGAKISLQSFGVTSMGAQAVLFAGPTKAYYKDDSQAQIIVWNPRDMVVERAIALPEELVKPGKATSLSNWVQREGEAFFTVSWSSAQYDKVDPGTRLVRLDTTTDQITVTEETRCRGISKAAKYQDTLYFFSGVINGFGYAVHGDEGGQQDCTLRILPGQSGFDPDYLGTLAPTLADHEVGTGVSITADGRVWYQVVDTTKVNTEPGATYGEWYADGWTWRHYDLTTLGDEQIPVPEEGAFSSAAYVIGSNFFIAQSAADYSTTTLIDLSGPAPRGTVTFPGFALDVMQVR